MRSVAGVAAGEEADEEAGEEGAAIIMGVAGRLVGSTKRANGAHSSAWPASLPILSC